MDFSSLTGPVLDNTIAALIGAFIISFLTWSYRRFREVQNEKKYSIAGDYRAYYEDLGDDGAVTIEKSNLKIKQRGLKIYADDYDETQDKDWLFEGEIDPTTGHVYGHYKTKSKHETGLGVCIFEQKKNGTLDGIWAGYDENIDIIDKGRYTLIKRLEISIRKARKSDAVAVLQLLDQELGEDWIHMEDVEKAIANNFLYVADYEGQIAGFTLLRMLDMPAFEKELKDHEYKIPRDIQIAGKNTNIGFIEAVATNPDFQRRGIGAKLIQKSLEVLKTSRAEIVVALGWKPEDVNIEPTLRMFDFKDRHEFEKFWYQESLDEETPATCPGCGEPPCTCGAVLFTKALSVKA